MVDEQPTNDERAWYVELVDLRRTGLDGEEEARVIELADDRWTLHARRPSPKFQWHIYLVRADGTKEAEGAFEEALAEVGGVGVCFTDAVAGPFATMDEAHAEGERQRGVVELEEVRCALVDVLCDRVVSLRGAWFLTRGPASRFCYAKSHAEAAKILGVEVDALEGYVETADLALAWQAAGVEWLAHQPAVATGALADPCDELVRRHYTMLGIADRLAELVNVVAYAVDVLANLNAPLDSAALVKIGTRLDLARQGVLRSASACQDTAESLLRAGDAVERLTQKEAGRLALGQRQALEERAAELVELKAQHLDAIETALEALNNQLRSMAVARMAARIAHFNATVAEIANAVHVEAQRLEALESALATAERVNDGSLPSPSSR